MINEFLSPNLPPVVPCGFNKMVCYGPREHERWGVREGVCPVELFIRTGSITETQRGFRRERNQQEAPSPNAIHRWVRQWRKEGSVTCKVPLGRPSSVRTSDKFARVLAFVSSSPRRSARNVVTSQRYKEMINECLSPNLPPNSGTLWFQQDGVLRPTRL